MDYNKINKIDVDGSGNIILQDINGGSITVNYNDAEAIKGILQSVTNKQTTELKQIIAQMEQKIKSNTTDKTGAVSKKVDVSINDLLDNGEIDKVFQELEKKEISDRFLYNRLKKEYIVGISGIQLADWIQKMKVFVNNL